MTTHLATSERRPLCVLCQRERAWPPAALCSACERYIRDCEAEASEGR